MRLGPKQKWDRTENFSKFVHLLWDLGLVQRYLKTREDFLVLLAMLRYSDFHTGECVVFVPTLMRETGVKHPTQIHRIQRRIEKTGAFWRPEGNKGFKMVHGKWAKRYFRSTGKHVIAHAVEKRLIPEEKLAEIEMKAVAREIKAEAESAHSSCNAEDVPGGNGGWGNVDAIMRLPTNVDDLLDDERIGV